MRDTTKSTFVVCGLPGSGKTTFLAALWHIVQSGETETRLKLKSLGYGDYEYVNAIRDRWQRGSRQPRTVGEVHAVGIDLVDEDGNEVQVLFPDHSGETYDSMWGMRTCSKAVADHLRNRQGVLLFLRSEGMKQPLPLIDIITIEAEMHMALSEQGMPGREASPSPATPSGRGPQAADDLSVRDWIAEEAPDQVKVVDILQILSSHMHIPHDEKLAIFVSAWDIVDQNLTPAAFVEKKFPLLDQYLTSAEHGFDIRIYGLSAQGGEYVAENHTGELPQKLRDLLDLNNASARIKLVSDGGLTNDLTEPISWLMK